MIERIENFFNIREMGSDFKTELIAGITTFMTLSYIIIVQPTVLSTTGMDFGAVMAATCIASAFATFLMGFLAKYPIALAPAMGHNFYFAFTVCGATVAGGLGYSWQEALGANMIAGLIFVILSRYGFREKVLNAIPESLKNAIAVGIGLLIALLGFEWAGIVVDTPGVLVGLGDLHSPPVLLSIFGLAVIGILISLRVKGAILWGIISSALMGLPFQITEYHGIISSPPSIGPTIFKLDIMGLVNNPGFVAVIFVFFFLVLFDTVGTLVGVGEQGGFIRDGKLPRAEKALFSDAVGTVAGTILGTSTVTSYIESAAGVAEGGRTGLANLVTGFLMLGSLFFYPLVRMVGGGYEVSKGVFLYPAIAPALIIVGSMMLRSVHKISWEDPTESIPAFLTLIIMPATINITEGIAFGFISYSLFKLICGKWKETHWIIHLFSVLFIIRYIYL